MSGSRSPLSPALIRAIGVTAESRTAAAAQSRAFAAMTAKESIPQVTVIEKNEKASLLSKNTLASPANRQKGRAREALRAMRPTGSPAAPVTATSIRK